ncbi:lytic transglycosylase domain-containing protein [Trueperella pyogenes]|uniref:lytic transglycosylase domain-containing protein n=1 Tax=Trueperella pyogenes TaxID=1661 RepID=UPI00043ABA50|nr:lytic transglycosylase domain-containing protein [Trueperella pyogenes]AHU88837.1 murein transglycosylase [Trueperella pyogenes]OQD39836.1 hypothetical protein B1R42_02065 [Trueperella pyogenes]OQD40147.1 hypothetical protein B1R42_01475 [Trueperella pyogenes]
MSTWIRRSGATLAATTAATFIAPVAQAATAPTLHTPIVKAPIYKSPEMTYQVKSGDTLWSIAKRTGSTVDAIAKANSLRSIHLIFPGQQLKIPSPAAPAPANTPVAAQAAPPVTSAVTYTVKAGDTLSKIARQYKTSVAKLAADNAIPNPNRISIGQRLTIADAAAVTTPAPAPVRPVPEPAPAPEPAPVSAPEPAPAPAPQASTNASYVVRPGDTLSGIAMRHGTTVAALTAANKISNPNRIAVGQKLTIAGSTTVEAAPAAPAKPAKQLVKNNFPGYTYAQSTVDAANQNKHTLINRSVPSRDKVQSMIVSVARQMGVDAKLALAHAFVESGFDATAVSPANAIGTMQVIPSSGEWASQLVGRKLDLLDPHDNIVAGVAIIRALQRSADNFEQGIAGYYQGLGGVKRYGMRPDTVKYVDKVKAAMARF